MTRQRRVTILLLSGLIAIVAISFYWKLKNNFEWVEEEVRHGFSDEAHRNPFLAAEYFLAGRGLDVRSQDGRGYLFAPPPPTDLLVINRLPEVMSQTWLDRLTRWVRGGGTIVISVPPDRGNPRSPKDDRRPHPLFEAMGLRVEPIPDTDRQLCEHDDIDWIDVRLHLPSVRTAANKKRRPKAKFLCEYRLEIQRDHLVWAVFGQTVVGATVPFGLGKVIVTTDNSFMTNDKIREADHAYLLWKLVGQGADQTIWLYYSTRSVSLLRKLWIDAAPALLAGVVLVFVIAWQQMNRFGPIQRSVVVPRRNFVEHLDAAGRFEWRAEHACTAMRETQLAVEHLWKRRFPKLTSCSTDEMAEPVAAMTGLAADKIRTALSALPTRDEDVVRLTQTLQTILKQ